MKDMRPQRDPHDLRELLQQLTPAGPETTDRASQVVERARRTRRRRGAAGALAIGVAAAAVIVGPHFIGEQDSAGRPPSTIPATHPTRPTPSTPTATVPSRGRVVRYSCPSVDQTPQKTFAPKDGRIPHGAVRAWICPSQDAFTNWTPPIDALTTNLDSLADTFNGLPKPRANIMCTLEGSIDNYFMTFLYPDGREIRLHGVGSGCSFVKMTPAQRSLRMGARNLLQAYLSDLTLQRSVQRPPAGEITAPPCSTTLSLGGGGFIPKGSNLGMDRATICGYHRSGDHLTLYRTAHFTHAQVLMIDRDYLDHSGGRIREHCTQYNQLHRWVIVGLTSWDDQVHIWSECDMWEGPGGEWAPSPKVRRMIQSVIGG